MTESSQAPVQEDEDSLLKARSGSKDFLSGLADAFEAQGNAGEAKKYRELAQKQSGLKDQRVAEMKAHHDARLEEEKRNQPKITPLQPHERADASRNEGLREQVEKMLQIKKSPSSPNTAPKPPLGVGTPTTGK